MLVLLAGLFTFGWAFSKGRGGLSPAVAEAKANGGCLILAIGQRITVSRKGALSE